MLLRLETISIAAAGRTLLHDLSLDVDTGSLLALSGPSGCGKTTLLRALAGLIDPAGGRVLFRGQTPETIGYPAYRRQVILLQQQPVMLDLPVMANLERPFHYRHAPGPFPADRAREWLARVGIEPERFEQPARSLSVGQQQRVALVRAMLLEPAVLLLDEPTSGLDAESAASVESFIRRQAGERGLAALVVAHDRQRPELWCDGRIDLHPFMRQGQIALGAGSIGGDH